MKTETTLSGAGEHPLGAFNKGQLPWSIFEEGLLAHVMSMMMNDDAMSELLTAEARCAARAFLFPRL